MNTLFRRDLQPAEETGNTAYLDRPDQNGYSFVLKPKGREGVSEELTLRDRQELVKTELNNPVWFAKAKRAYAAGGRTRDIKSACNCSPSSAKKMYMAFNRAKKGQ